jgi:acylphosphatase
VSSAEAAGDTVRKHLKVSGRVQGVFYRETLRRMAVEAGVHGSARNTRDGVDVVLEGPRDAVERLARWCRQGPPHAVVIHVQVEDEPPAGETEFRVR